MYFDNADDGKMGEEEDGKGVMGVKRDVEESFTCFLLKVGGLVGEGWGGGVGVDVDVDGVGDGDGEGKV